MADRLELVEAALEVYPEGLALLDGEGRVVFWNRAAELLTGYPGAEVIGRTPPEGLEPLECARAPQCAEASAGAQHSPRLLVHARHKLGHDVPVLAGSLILRDALGARIGSAAVFHCGELLSALPHCEMSDVPEVRQSQAELEQRLASEHEMLLRDGAPLAVLCVCIDQAQELRKTHGARACETMLETVERILANGLRPGEEIGRWSDNQFLVLSPIASPQALEEHAKALAGLAGSTDFRWWGDRVPLTASVAVAQASPEETLAEWMRRVQSAAQESAEAGGNCAALQMRRQPCSPS